MPSEPLSQKEIEDRLRELPGWAVEDDRIVRTYRLGTHVAAAAFVAHIAAVQDESNHHSDLTLGYDTVRLSVNSHDAGDVVTDADFALAERVEALAPAHGAR
ncbi:4a-hydroxytetrahydrobiopterin dehydratase [Streptomyces subrutilus]|uniref:Putative pterin-4-alpha-carbinolamine dehydratase n=1 Tax=Streptomyces subrutilus TaxID=36818 RepID=A0A5P2UG90_9ACTN|nr:4a-hydroxytetrahydrobiopterin dehydratase [Streptomyces subrutilus]QEU78028.1 4a-hydroxytetrahydrobiopterin dehydratase [Streptomyces subrutilus]WSJ32821.1 4a-hydroxytetrahydrobiopterin dehydratase [Streptomyces subrutilus]GGZ56716.1 putative pterin-4-alpha-carbinolamine dehydratase [Streptomyces subrutilus]